MRRDYRQRRDRRRKRQIKRRSIIMSWAIKWAVEKFLGDSESLRVAILSLLDGLDVESNRILRLLVKGAKAIVSDADLWQEVYDLIMGLFDSDDGNKVGAIDMNDPAVTDAIDKIWDSPTATQMVCEAIASNDEAFQKSRADAIGEEVGIDPFTIIAIISAAAKILAWIRERRQNR